MHAGPPLAPWRGVTGEPSVDPQAQPAESIYITPERVIEGEGIVETHGDHLVILHRGRLFTVDLTDDALRPVSYVDVTPHPRHRGWYEELLVYEDTVVVIGDSYQVGATELALFDIDHRGELSYVDTYFLSSYDYFSAGHYTSVQRGDLLVSYMPLPFVDRGQDDPCASALCLGHWDGGSRRTRRRSNWRSVMGEPGAAPPPASEDVSILHTVVACDLSSRRLGCRAHGVEGSHEHSFYMARHAVYVWTYAPHWEEGADFLSNEAIVYRIPMRGGPIGKVVAWGTPIDRFSYEESADGHLNVLIDVEPLDDEEPSSRVPPVEGMGLLRLPLGAFDGPGGRVPDEAYHDLPDLPDIRARHRNRFIDDVVVYGLGRDPYYYRGIAETSLFVHHYAETPSRTEEVQLPHPADRIEALGAGAIVVGGKGDELHLTTLDLHGRAEIADRFVRDRAAEGELRSHGFFFGATTDDEGVLGIPLLQLGSSPRAFWSRRSTRVLYLGVRDLKMLPLGTIDSRRTLTRGDACMTSCMDWFGNSRPIVYRGRIFALMGYEVIEGRVVDGVLQEVGRVDVSDMLWGGGLRH